MTTVLVLVPLSLCSTSTLLFLAIDRIRRACFEDESSAAD